jgi:DDE superfamily endonuclease
VVVHETLVCASRCGLQLAARRELVRDRPSGAQAQERECDGARPRRRAQKKLIETAYRQTELALWTEDEAGPYQTVPYPGRRWQLLGRPGRYPHEYIRNGTAKLLTLFYPATGEVRVKGVLRTTNAVLHPWLKAELLAVLAELPEPIERLDPAENRRRWERWQEGLSVPFALPESLPPLRMLLVLDNLQGHHSPDLVLWLVQHGIMPLYTPIGGSWLNMTESIQGILKDRALNGEHPQSPTQIIEWLEATARGWNHDPTPFVWDGKRKARRNRAREKSHRLGGSGACTTRVVARRRAA